MNKPRTHTPALAPQAAAVMRELDQMLRARAGLLPPGPEKLYALGAITRLPKTRRFI